MKIKDSASETFRDLLKNGQTRYEPKRNPKTELQYFKLLPMETFCLPGTTMYVVAAADNAGETYVALRDTFTRLEYVEKAVLTVDGSSLKVAPVQIEDELEWKSAFEFFVKMKVLQNKDSQWRKAWRKEK